MINNLNNYHYQQIAGNVYNKIMRNASANLGAKQFTMISFSKIGNIAGYNSKNLTIKTTSRKNQKNIQSAKPNFPQDKLSPRNYYNLIRPRNALNSTNRPINTADPTFRKTKKKDSLFSASLKIPHRQHYINPPINFSKSLPRTGLKNIINPRPINIHLPPDMNMKAKEESKENISLYVSSAKSVSEFSYSEDQNSEHRETMEDFHKIIDGFMSDKAKGFFSIYDGHGGSEPVKYAKDRFPEIFRKFLIETNQNIEKSLVYSFQKLDDELKLFSECENVGSTATVVYICRESDRKFGSRRVAYCANVGDSKCVLVTCDSCRTLSTEHRCTDQKEVARVKKSGGVVFSGRVFGQLAITRALGDHAMKKYGVVCTPSITKHVISDKDKFIIICSDGVWDVVSDDEVLELGGKYSSASEFSSVLVKKSIERDSRDNISCIVIKI